MNHYLDKDKNKENRIYFENECFDWVSTIISAISALVIVFTIFIKLIVVNGVSMNPTLHDKDWMILKSFLCSPQKGDIVVIQKKSLNEPIIKRIIATENDLIDIKEGKVYINGEIKDEKKYIGDSITQSYSSNQFPMRIPKGHYFVMGDNRDNSLDSRFEEVGIVSRSEILGEAKVIVFPFDRIKIT